MEKIIKNSAQSNKYQFKPFDMFQTLEANAPKYSENLKESEHKPSIIGNRQVILPPSADETQFEKLTSFIQNKPIVEQADNQPHYQPQAVPQPFEDNEVLQAQKGELESLLKKIDDLTTSIIKMEMQMERQQSEFNARLEQERAQAKELGFNEARMQLEAQYNEKINSNDRMIISSIKKLDTVSSVLGSKVEEIEKDLTAAAINLAYEVIKLEVSSRSSQIATSLVKDLLSKLKDASNVVVKVSQEDYNMVKSELGQNSKIMIEADEAIARGGVIILSDIGNLDGQILARFEKIKQEALS